jgi:hypothetical protein
MVIDDFNLKRVRVPPYKANPVAVIYPNAVLRAAISLEFFEPETRPNRQIFKPRGRIQQD